MTSREFTTALAKLGITQIALATKLVTNERTVRRWTSGDWPVPPPVALLLNLMLDTNKTVDDLRG
jgi:DNA-binding transcriptional regulator YiaG